MTKTIMRIVNAAYIASAVGRSQYPELELPEIAMIGRSNVGKSSLINSLCRHHGLARTSSTPGKTQTLNFYQVKVKIEDVVEQDAPDEASRSLTEPRRESFMLVDLPGFGYAKASQQSRKQWAGFIEDYLCGSVQLKQVFQLIDIRHAPMDSDIQKHEWLLKKKIPVQIIATKADKLTRGVLTKNLQVLANCLHADRRNIITYSSITGQGRDELIELIKNRLWNESF